MAITRSDGDGTATLRLGGVLDATNASVICRVLDSVRDERLLRVVLDMSSLRLIDTAGIRTLVRFEKAMSARATPVDWVGVQGQPLLMFRALKMPKVADSTAP